MLQGARSGVGRDGRIAGAGGSGRHHSLAAAFALPCQSLFVSPMQLTPPNGTRGQRFLKPPVLDVRT
jgi:hypothetical protein